MGCRSEELKRECWTIVSWFELAFAWLLLSLTPLPAYLGERYGITASLGFSLVGVALSVRCLWIVLSGRMTRAFGGDE